MTWGTSAAVTSSCRDTARPVTLPSSPPPPTPTAAETNRRPCGGRRGSRGSNTTAPMEGGPQARRGPRPGPRPHLLGGPTVRARCSRLPCAQPLGRPPQRLSLKGPAVERPGRDTEDSGDRGAATLPRGQNQTSCPSAGGTASPQTPAQAGPSETSLWSR